jgi:hypothetical protein
MAADDDKRAFHNAYMTVGSGRDFVRIHRVREQLGWLTERFNATLEQLAADYKIELHGGDPSRLSKEELDNSYRDNYGQQYITLSWRG